MTQHDEHPVAPAVDAPAVDAPTDDAPTDDAPTDADQRENTAAEATPERSAGSRLEEEGEIAADYLEELLDIADLDGDIDIDVENGRAVVSILADPVATRRLRRLVGADGQVLEALQELTRLAVQTRTGDRSRMMLDVAGFRAERRRELETVATRAVREVQRTGEPVRLDPMSPFERKVVHDVVAAEGLVSESEGDEPQRRVVVSPSA